MGAIRQVERIHGGLVDAFTLGADRGAGFGGRRIDRGNALTAGYCQPYFYGYILASNPTRIISGLAGGSSSIFQRMAKRSFPIRTTIRELRSFAGGFGNDQHFSRVVLHANWRAYFGTITAPRPLAAYNLLNSASSPPSIWSSCALYVAHSREMSAYTARSPSVMPGSQELAA